MKNKVTALLVLSFLALAGAASASPEPFTPQVVNFDEVLAPSSTPSVVEIEKAPEPLALLSACEEACYATYNSCRAACTTSACRTACFNALRSCIQVCP